MLKRVFMIPKIRRWRLHNPLAVLIIERAARLCVLQMHIGIISCAFHERRRIFEYLTQLPD